MEALLPAASHIAFVRLRVKDLHRELAFYADVLGMQVAPNSGKKVALSAAPTSAGTGAGQPPYLIELIEESSALASPPRSAGLYHAALRFPTRAALAQIVLQLLERRYPLQGASNHVVSEAIYLADPEGNGIELYWDRPRALWRMQGDEIYMTTAPLDLDDLLNQATPSHGAGLSPDTDIGHIHLCATNLARAEKFYASVIGFRVTSRSYPGALFFAAGTYHHHVGANVWYTHNGMPLPSNTPGLMEFGIAVPAEGWDGAMQRLINSHTPFEQRPDGSISLHDPDGVGVRLIPMKRW